MTDAIRRLAFLVPAAVILSLLLRYYPADKVGFLRWNLYLPLPVLAGAGVAFALAWKIAWDVRGALALTVVLAATPPLSREQPLLFGAPGPKENRTDSISLLTYNVRSYNNGPNEVVDKILEANPDILGVVEGTFRGRAPDLLVRALGDEYHWAVGKGTSVASKYPILESTYSRPAPELFIQRVLIETPRGRVALLLTDIYAPMTRQDKRVFEQLWLTLEAEQMPAIMSGDLNTPRGSLLLREATRNWGDAYLAASRERWLTSWPSKLPIWQIDHTFFTGGIKIMNAEFGGGLASDHLYQHVEFRVE